MSENKTVSNFCITCSGIFEGCKNKNVDFQCNNCRKKILQEIRDYVTEFHRNTEVEDVYEHLCNDSDRGIIDSVSENDIRCAIMKLI